jgi:serralysin
VADQPQNSKFSDFITNSAYEILVEKAVALWSAVSGIRMTLVSDSASTDIRVGFETLNTSTTNTIGSTSYSYSGNPQVFTPGVTVGVEDPVQDALSVLPDGDYAYAGYTTDLFQDFVHELGHSLGLAHNTVDAAAQMNPTLTASNRSIDSNDAAAIDQLYGGSATALSAAQITDSGPDSYIIAAGGTINPFAGLTVTDGASLHEVVTVTVTGGGTLSDPTAGAEASFSNSVFTESGDNLTATDYAQTILRRLIYTAPTTATNPSFKVEVDNSLQGSATNSSITAGTGTGFDGDQVTLDVYYPDLTASSLQLSGSATVVPGTVTFPNILTLNHTSTTLLGPSVNFSNTDILIDYPVSEEGVATASGTFNGFVFTTAAGDPAITGVSLASTNIPGLTASDLSFTAHSISINEAGLTLPATVPGAIDIAASFTGTPAPTPAPTPGLDVIDTSTGQSVPAVAQPYTGPVSGLQEQYVNITADNLNITASTPNWFIHSGSGEDALAVSGGINVLDGGTGSNFLTGGSGTDTFFIDDRAATADIWSTLVNFHAGDAATVWGVTPSDFDLAWVDGQGAAGYTGLTLSATAAGKPNALMTLAGFSQADLTNGRLSVTFGTDPGSGSSYMYVHANS